MTPIDRIRLFRERGYACGNCGRQGTDLHHGLFRRAIRHPELDNPINLDVVCSGCHSSGVCDSKAYRKAFYRRQCERYGRDVVDAWVAGLPLKVKDIF